MLTEQCTLTYERNGIKMEFYFFEDASIVDWVRMFRCILLQHTFDTKTIDEYLPVEWDNGHEEPTDS